MLVAGEEGAVGVVVGGGLVGGLVLINRPTQDLQYLIVQLVHRRLLTLPPNPRPILQTLNKIHPLISNQILQQLAH